MKLQILDIRNIPVNGTLYNLNAHQNGDPYWLEFVKPHLEEIDVEVLLGTFDKIDKSKNWFISLAPLAWNWATFTGDIISDFPIEIQKEILYGNGYLILNHECESFTESFFDKLYNVLKNSKISPTKILYMVGAADASREYLYYVKKHNLPKDQQIAVMSSFHVYKRLQFNLQDFDYDLKSKKEKKFLSLNRVGRNHRAMLVGLLSHYNLIDSGFVSLGVQKDEFSSIVNELKITISNVREQVFSGLEKIVEQLPLQVDNIDLQINQFNTTSLPSYFYEKSCFSLVSSTFGLAMNEPSVGFTEKEIKPILYKHPFIIYNLPGTLKHLKSMGFLTFSKWFDESYDDELDDLIRLDKIVAEVARLSNISFDDWDRMLIEMRPILLHNYNRLTNYNTEHCFFNSDLKNFLYYVS